MKFIVGLGNPGREYERTPHNAGFRAADLLCETLGGTWKAESHFKAHVAKVTLPGAGALLLIKPQTFMNLSGDAVSSLAAFYKVAPCDIIVLVDDVALPPGRIRIRPGGSAGGHNGLKSLMDRLGSRAFIRVRIGVGMGHHPVGNLADRVLGRIEAEDEPLIEAGLKLAAEAAVCAAQKGADAAMNDYNGPEKTTAPATAAPNEPGAPLPHA